MQKKVVGGKKPVHVYREEPVIVEERLFNKNYLLVSFIIAFAMISVDFFLIFYFEWSFVKSVLVSAVLITVYSVFLFFLLEPKILKRIEQVEVRTFEKPVTREVIVEKPVVQRVIVEKPIVEKVKEKVYFRVLSKKVEPVKYNYLGSSNRKVYHKRICRLSKLIKPKYKISNNSKDYFKKQGFRACKVCIKKK